MTDASEASAAPVVSVRDLRKQFRRQDGRMVPAIDGVSLEVRPGEVLVLLGPSGCGKTTLLRAIAGLETPDSGVIGLHGRPAFDSGRRIDLPPEERRISMIFQSYALWPHLTALDNVAYPLLSRGASGKTDAAARAAAALAQVGIGDLGAQYPAQLSGGQQQRVALARAIVARDDLILFDEPLSNVDARVRQQLRIELIATQRTLGFSAVYVTHDQTEAMALAHRIAVLRLGRIEQIGPPAEIYDRPRSRYVANFIGVTNELPGRIVAVDPSGDARVETAFGPVTVCGPTDGRPGDEVCVLARPEHCALTAEPSDGGLCLEGVVANSVFLGAYTETILRCGDRLLQVWGQGAPLPVESKWRIAVRSDRLRLVPMES